MNDRVRAMKVSDLKALSRLYAETYDRLGIGEKWNARTARRLLAYWLRRQPDLAFTAECDGVIAGAFVAGIKPWWDANHLVDGELFVHPDFQKKGLGGRLLAAMFEKARKKYRVSSFDTFTYTKTEFPLKWYASLGLERSNDYAILSGSVGRILGALKKKQLKRKQSPHRKNAGEIK